MLFWRGFYRWCPVLPSHPCDSQSLFQLQPKTFAVIRMSLCFEQVSAELSRNFLEGCDVNGLKVPPCKKACEFLSLQDQGDRLERLRCCLSLPKPFLWYLACNISEVDISIPIPSPRGIIACTLRDAQSMSIRDMEHEIAGCRRHVCTCQASVTPLRPLRCVARPCPGTQADRSSRTGRALRGRS